MGVIEIAGLRKVYGTVHTKEHGGLYLFWIDHGALFVVGWECSSRSNSG